MGFLPCLYWAPSIFLLWPVSISLIKKSIPQHGLLPPFYCVASVFRLMSNATRSILYVKQEVPPWSHLTRAPLSTKFNVFPTWLVEKLHWETLCFKHLHNFVPDYSVPWASWCSSLPICRWAHCWTGCIGVNRIKGNEYKNMSHFPDYFSPLFVSFVLVYDVKSHWIG